MRALFCATVLALSIGAARGSSVARAEDAPPPLSIFGTLGSGPGQMDHPFGIAYAPDGNFYVADQHNHRIEKFRSRMREAPRA